jgi:DNA-binding FrmR family transcriptional regulator
MQADQAKTIRKMNIIKGQIEGIIRMMEEDRYCMDISNQLLAVTQALKGVNGDVLSAHLHSCVMDSLTKQDSEDMEEKMEEMTKVIQKLLR